MAAHLTTEGKEKCFYDQQEKRKLITKYGKDFKGLGRDGRKH